TLERKLLDFERQIDKMNVQLNERDNRVKKVENDRKILDSKLEFNQKEQEMIINNYKKQVEEVNNSQKITLDELRNLKQINNELEEKFRLKDYNENRAKQSKVAAEQRVETLNQNMEEILKELNLTQQKLQTSQQEVTDAQKELEGLRKLKVNENETESGADTPGRSRDVLRNELSRQVERLKLLEQSNTRLSREVEMHRVKQTNIEVLKEENRNLNNQLNSIDDLRRKLATVEIEREKLLKEKSEWTVYLEKDQDQSLSTPHDLSKALAIVRIENATLQERLGSRETQMKSRDRMIAELEARLEEAERERDNEYATRIKAESQVTIAERNRELDKRRIQMLNEQLKSYTAEEKLLATNGYFDQRQDLKISHLEELLEGHQNEISRLQQELAESKKQLEQSINSTNSSNDQPETKSLKRQVDNLERDLGRGEYNSRTTQVLAPDGGPLQNDMAIRSATLKALKDENSALLKRIGKLGKGMNSSVNGDESLIPRESLVSLQHEVERLEAELTRSIKSRRRLTEMYEEGTRSYRKAMWEILGYSLETVANGEFRLRSIFKDENSSSMLFVPGKSDGGSIEYKPGNQPFHKSREVIDSFHTWVESRKSLPCFTAALTLELYESSTR
ncbi:hypothetical protein CROQUDRAFT_25610, partial [Cronartium quercuum f. sp. fusiforme G11]